MKIKDTLGNAVEITSEKIRHDETTVARAITDAAEQLNQLSESINEISNDVKHLILTSPNLFNLETEDVGYYRSLSPNADIFTTKTANANYSTNIISVKPNTKYIISESNFYVYGANADGKRTSIINSDASFQKNLIVTTGPNDYYIVISYSKIAKNMMVVEGETLPSEYISYGEIYGEVLELLKSQIDNNTDAISLLKPLEEYHVGVGQTYASFIDCLKSLKGNTNKKVIYVHNGTYDLFEEMGGIDFINSIGNQDWKEVNTFVPDNTKIIGLGNVVLQYLPTSAQATVASASRISPINVASGIEMENIFIDCQNCRYGIHDEGSGRAENNEKVHKYKNVRITYRDGGVVGSPSGICFGCGFNGKTTFEFDSCVFEVKRPSGGALYMHDWGGNASILIKNCVMKNLNNFNTSSIQFGNNHGLSANNYVYVIVENSHLYGKIFIINGGGVTGAKNCFDLTLLRCNEIGIDIASTLDNQHEPKIY